MKKAINLTPIFVARAEIERAEHTVDYVSDRRDRIADKYCGTTDKSQQGMVEKAARDLEDAKKELADVRADYLKKIAALNEACAEGNGKARSRTIDGRDVVNAVKKLDQFLKGISSKSLTGVRAIIDVNAQDFPKAYLRKGRPESTLFTVEYKSGWRVINIFRDDTRRARSAAEIIHTDASKAALVEKYSKMDNVQI